MHLIAHLKSESRVSLALKAAVLIGVLVSLGLAATALGSSQASPEKLFIAYEDGTCGNSWRTTVRAEFETEAAKHPEIGKVVYKCAQNKLNQAIADIQSLSSQDVDILVIFSDWGKSLLPAIRTAYKKGVVVVPWNSPVGGTAGKDYTAYVGFSIADQAKLFANYIIAKLDGKGNVVGVGGPAGNDYDNDHLDVMKKIWKQKAPGIKFLEHAWADWAPGPSSKAMATLLSKYDKIDAVWTPEATTVKPELDQFIVAKRPLPVFTSLDVNGMMGDFLKLKPKNPTLEWGFASALTWGVRNAIKVGLQAKAGKPIDKKLLLLKNYMSDCAKVCKKLYQKSLPDDYIPTTQVPPAIMKKYLK
jgi:ribose transport system substrate-binding protein